MASKKSGAVNTTKKVDTIHDGQIHLQSSDDGINAVGGNDGAQMNRQVRPDRFATGNRYLYINGGTIAMDADGDGLYAGGTYTGGTQEASLTLASIVTGANPRGGFRGNPPGGRARRPGG